MENGKLLKILGLTFTVLSAGIAVAAAIVDEKKLDLKVSEKVSEALENLSIEES